MSPVQPPFKILWRVFIEQFAANESATSDLQTRRAIIGVITFLITPGLFLMMKTMSGYELMVMVARPWRSSVSPARTWAPPARVMVMRRSGCRVARCAATLAPSP